MKLKNESIAPPQAKALARYNVISAYVALAPKRGKRGRLLKQLSKRTWTDEAGEPFTVAADTIRVWIRRYRNEGLAGLEDKQRPSRGCHAISPEQVEIACKLKTEVPERTVERILTMMETLGYAHPGNLKRSTLHRALQRAGLSARGGQTPDRHDLDRFQAEAPNDLWQSDMLVGPWLKDPAHPERMRRAYLYAFIDDHSRMVLHGRFSFKGDLPALELVFKRSIQKYGLCKRLYYDNGQVYRSNHMRQIVATLGIHRIIHTRPYRPMGHGKIEALNRTIRSAFIAELKASSIETLDALNEAFVAWVDLEYNRRVHSETGQTPLEMWHAGSHSIRAVDEEQLRQAFLFREQRTPDKAGIFSLFGIAYQVGPKFARRRLEVRYDPEAMESVEIWHNTHCVERVRPFEVQTHRRPKPKGADDSENLHAKEKSSPVADWLNTLVMKRRASISTPATAPIPTALDENVQAITHLLVETLDAAVVDTDTIHDYVLRYGPLDLETAQKVMQRFVAQGQTSFHSLVYLEAIRDAAHGGDHA